jgi:hypothetical protein
MGAEGESPSPNLYSPRVKLTKRPPARFTMVTIDLGLTPGHVPRKRVLVLPDRGTCAKNHGTGGQHGGKCLAMLYAYCWYIRVTPSWSTLVTPRSLRSVVSRICSDYLPRYQSRYLLIGISGAFLYSFALSTCLVGLGNHMIFAMT